MPVSGYRASDEHFRTNTLNNVWVCFGDFHYSNASKTGTNWCVSLPEGKVSGYRSSDESFCAITPNSLEYTRHNVSAYFVDFPNPNAWKTMTNWCVSVPECTVLGCQTSD